MRLGDGSGSLGPTRAGNDVPRGNAITPNAIRQVPAGQGPVRPVPPGPGVAWRMMQSRKWRSSPGAGVAGLCAAMLAMALAGCGVPSETVGTRTDIPLPTAPDRLRAG